MGEKVLVSPSELSDMMRTEPVVLIDTRDPAIYAKAHIPGAVDVRDVFTYLATSTPQRLGRASRQGRQFVHHDCGWSEALCLEQFAHQFQCGRCCRWRRALKEISGLNRLT